MNDFELAQLNIANLVAPLESAELADFVANIESQHEEFFFDDSCPAT